jgi:hypothetical protein
MVESKPLRRTDAWQQQAEQLGDDRIQYLSGKRLREYSPEELGKFQIITDVFGGFSYSFLFADLEPLHNWRKSDLPSRHRD